MTAQDQNTRPIDGPGVERTITLTDAVVAIAMTLLILPLVELSGDMEFDQLSLFVAEHGDLLLSFVISFVVIYVFWMAHGTTFRRLDVAGVADAPGLTLLNLLWLLVIAFLPFPTALVGHRLDTTSAPVYVGTMLVLSALTSGLTVVASRATGDGRLSLGWLTTAILAVCTAIAFFAPSLALYLLLLLAVVRTVEIRIIRRRATAEPARPGR